MEVKQKINREKQIAIKLPLPSYVTYVKATKLASHYIRIISIVRTTNVFPKPV